MSRDEGEKRLYRAVLMQALFDLVYWRSPAFNKIMGRNAARRSDEAIEARDLSEKLFFNDSATYKRHLHFLCDSADIHVDGVVKTARKLYDGKKYVKDDDIWDMLANG